MNILGSFNERHIAGALKNIQKFLSVFCLNSSVKQLLQNRSMVKSKRTTACIVINNFSRCIGALDGRE